MCGRAVTTELMAAVLGRQRLGGKKEVVLLPAAGGFFAYEPILKALQSTHPLPLAKYIVQQQGPEAHTISPLPVLLHGKLVSSNPTPQGLVSDTEGMQVSCADDSLLYRREGKPCKALDVMTSSWQ